MASALVRVLLLRTFLALGGCALFVMVGVDFANVMGRPFGLQAVGSIEIIQLCIVVAVGSAIVAASLSASHAAVHLLLTRVGPAWKTHLERLSEAATLLVFALLCAGGVWVLIDLWPGDERSDLLHLPIWPARVFWAASLALAGLVSVAGLFQTGTREVPGDA